MLMHVFIMYINFPLCASNFTPLNSVNVQRLCTHRGFCIQKRADKIITTVC